MQPQPSSSAQERNPKLQSRWQRAYAFLQRLDSKVERTLDSLEVGKPHRPVQRPSRRKHTTRDQRLPRGPSAPDDNPPTSPPPVVRRKRRVAIPQHNDTQPPQHGDVNRADQDDRPAGSQFDHIRETNPSSKYSFNKIWTWLDDLELESEELMAKAAIDRALEEGTLGRVPSEDPEDSLPGYSDVVQRNRFLLPPRPSRRRTMTHSQANPTPQDSSSPPNPTPTPRRKRSTAITQGPPPPKTPSKSDADTTQINNADSTSDRKQEKTAYVEYSLHKKWDWLDELAFEGEEAIAMACVDRALEDALQGKKL
ncbi:hypothetical protein ACLMJK_009076 [Lecanora helva]